MLIAWIWLEGIGKFPPHPSAKKIEFPTRGFAARGKFFFFALGFGGNFPIPSRHIQAIVSLAFECDYDMQLQYL